MRSRLSTFGFILVLAAASEALGQVVNVSVATDGTEANSNSLAASMSATGRFVTFLSFATNLVPGDANGFEDVFLRDRDTDADGVFDEPGAVSTVLVSQRGGVQANGPSHDPVITPDGRYVVFISFASNLFTSGQGQLPVSVVLRWDRLSGEIVLVSQTTAGAPLLAVRSVEPAVSDDGNQVIFTYGGSLESEASAGFRGVIYRRDIAAATLTQVSTVAVGPADRVESPSISGDGATIAYGVAVKADRFGTLSTVDGTVYVADAATGAVQRSYPGVQPRLSRDGAFVAFIEALAGFPIGGPTVRIHLASGERRSTGFVGLTWKGTVLSAAGRYFGLGGGLVDFHYASSGVFVGAQDRLSFDAAESIVAFAETQPTTHPIRILVGSLATLLDHDSDGLDDAWEGVFGLVSTPGPPFPVNGAEGVNGADGDPDGDGLTNLQEFQAGSNPAGSESRFLAEGSAGSFFTTRVAIANPTDVQANVAVRFDLADGGTVKRTVWVPPHTRVDYDSRAEGLATSSFSTVVESTQPVVVDRLMTWGDPGAVPYGSHAETSSAAPGTSWFLAEGSTVLGFQLFYLLQNPQATPTTATIRYLLPSGVPMVRTYDLPARSRTTIYVNTVPGLESTDVSAEITATQPIAVERAMYRSGGGQVFALGHAASAVAQPATTWMFAEGSTGAFFDTYLLLANPSSQPAIVQVEYLRDLNGPVTVTYPVGANSRFTVFVDAVPGVEQSNFGLQVTSNVPIVAERAMYWSGGFFDYYEGHVSAGATQAGSRWVLAESEQGGPYQAQGFVLIANTSATPVSVLVRSMPLSLFLAPATMPAIPIAGRSRVTVPLSSLAGFERGGIEVEQQGGGAPALVVEGALYWSTPTQAFAAGAGWLATRAQ